MNWENLKDKKCPHCSGALEPNADEAGFIHCTQCRFAIHKDKFKAILLHRTASAPKRRIKWQNLHEGRCPVCANFLRESMGVYRLIKCVSSTCDFHIGEARLDEILKDKNHPANLFREKLNNFVDEGLKKLNHI